MLRRAPLAVALCSLWLLPSCAATTKRLSRLSLEMTKGQVQTTIGEPTAVRGAIRNRWNQLVEVWEYRLYQYEGAIEGLSPFYNLYWLYFVDGRLAQWGQAGDWEKEAPRIRDVRFGGPPGSPAPAQSPPDRAPVLGERAKLISLGFTPQEAENQLGKPERKFELETTTRWDYPDLIVVFEAGFVARVIPR